MIGSLEQHLPAIVTLGFLVGMRHALEADHLAAVATLARDGRGVRESALRGAAWGLGHTLTLFLVGGICLLLGGVVPDGFARAAEAGVGAMLIVLGAQVFRRLRRPPALAGPPAGAPDEAPAGREAFPRRALAVGLVHGLAGSAALLLLAVEATASIWTGLLYIGVFGFGSIVGMAVLSAAIAVPFAASASWLGSVHRGLERTVGAAAMAVGVWVLAGAVQP